MTDGGTSGFAGGDITTGQTAAFAGSPSSRSGMATSTGWSMNRSRRIQASALLVPTQVLVTEANRGIGRALAGEEVSQGAARVYAGTLRPAGHADARISPLALDVTSAGQIQAAAQAVGSLGILINNAGVAEYDDLSDRAALERHLAVNLFGTHAVAQAFLPPLTASRGVIVNNLSINSLAAFPLMLAYSVSKAAAFSLTQSLRALLAGRGIRVHTVLTGPVDTDMTSSIDILKAYPESVAHAIFDAVKTRSSPHSPAHPPPHNQPYTSYRTSPDLSRKADTAMKTPPIVPAQEWEAARQQLLVKEKELIRARDALAAQRRRMPWLAVDKEYEFDGPQGKTGLAGLFEGRRQLIIYRAFFEPGVDGWPEHACAGCSLKADQIAHLAHLNARDTTLAFVSRAPRPDIERVKARMGWTIIPWYTILDGFDIDFGVDQWFGTNVFFRDHDRVYRTYFINERGEEMLGGTLSYLDITALGRQEDWEDSPDGYPQTPRFEWLRWHDTYTTASPSR